MPEPLDPVIPSGRRCVPACGSGSVTSPDASRPSAIAYVDESTDMQLTWAGYPTGLAQQVRRDRAESAQLEQSARRRAKSAQRRTQRLSH